MNSTIKQVAQASGVSTMTVSRILRGRTVSHNEETCSRVLQAAQQLGYRANASARAVRSGRFNTVALLLSADGVRSLLSGGLIEGITDVLNEGRQRMLVTRLTDLSLTDPRFIPEILRESVADGLLINYNTQIPPHLIELVAENNLPAVWINSKHPADCIYPNDRAGLSEAVHYLYGLGHRRIAYVDLVHTNHYSGEDRLAGYRDAVEGLSLPEISLRPEDAVPEHEEWPDYLERWLRAFSARERPTATITYVSHIGVSMVLAAQRLGLSVPRDLSLLAVADEPPRYLGFRMGAMLLPQARIGREAVEMLFERINDPLRSLPPRPIPLILEPSGSCAPPPG